MKRPIFYQRFARRTRKTKYSSADGWLKQRMTERIELWASLKKAQILAIREEVLAERARKKRRDENLYTLLVLLAMLWLVLQVDWWIFYY